MLIKLSRQYLPIDEAFMKKTCIPLISLLLICGFLSGVNNSTLKKFEKTQIVKEKQVDVVKFEAMKPDIEQYQKKSTTNLSYGYYQLYRNNIRKTNKVLLNKWLKEFK
jgi:hypothetical protein